MNILKLEDAQFCDDDLQCHFWIWPKDTIILYQLNNASPMTEVHLKSNDQVLLRLKGIHEPIDIWDKITSVLLDNDMICEPLNPMITSTPLPDMESP